MKTREQIFDRIKLSFEGTKHVLSKPRYVTLAGMTTLVLAVAIYFSINSGYYGTLLAAPMLSFGDKIGVFGTLLNQLGREIVTTFSGLILLVVSLLQGVAIAMMFYNLRRNKRMDTAGMTKSGLAVLSASLGLGCVPCGTSLILPLLSLVFSSSASAYAAANIASLIVLVIAAILSMYSLYSLGYIAVAHKAVEASIVNNEGEKK